VNKKLELHKIDEKHYSLDVRGFVCPYPQILTLRALNNISSSSVLEVILDNPPSVRDIPTVLKEKKYEVEVSNKAKGTWKIIVKLPGTSPKEKR
jgi:tRNA 2-thiouridine synthesizing protein A